MPQGGGGVVSTVQGGGGGARGVTGWDGTWGARVPPRWLTGDDSMDDPVIPRVLSRSVNRAQSRRGGRQPGRTRPLARGRSRTAPTAPRSHSIASTRRIARHQTPLAARPRCREIQIPEFARQTHSHLSMTSRLHRPVARRANTRPIGLGYWPTSDSRGSRASDRAQWRGRRSRARHRVSYRRAEASPLLSSRSYWRW